MSTIGARLAGLWRLLLQLTPRELRPRLRALRRAAARAARRRVPPVRKAPASSSGAAHGYRPPTISPEAEANYQRWLASLEPWTPRPPERPYSHTQAAQHDAHAASASGG